MEYPVTVLYDKRSKRFSVVVEVNDETHIERFSVSDFTDYIHNLVEEPLRIGGIYPQWNDGKVGDMVRNDIKEYLRLVYRTFKVTGQIQFLLPPE